MEGTSSLTQGCFLLNANAFRSSSVLTGSFQALPGETDGDASRREETYHQLWTTTKDIIEEIASRQNNCLLSDVVTFVRESSEQLRRLSPAIETSSTAGGGGKVRVSRPQRLEIPTAVVVAGVNVPDHGLLFKQLSSRLAASVSPHVVLLQSSLCSAGIKATWKEIMAQLISNSELSAQADEEGEMSKPKLSLPSLSLLQSWFLATHQASSGPRPPVVVIAEDFEGFPLNVLQDLIMTISPHLVTLPVVLILGVATSAAAIHSLLHSSSSLLCVEQFAAPSSSDTLTLLIENVLLSPQLPFKLGSQALQFLLHQYLCSSLSVSQFSHTLQMAMLEHFHWQPLSFFIGKWDTPNTLVRGLRHNQSEMIRATPSFRRYIDGLEDPEEQIKLLTYQQPLKVKAIQWLSRLRLQQHTLLPLLLCLHTLTRSLPTAPLGRRLHDIYLVCSERHIVDHGKFSTAWSLLKMMGREGLAASVKRCTAILKRAPLQDTDPLLSKTLQVFEKFLSELERIDGQVQQRTEERERGVETVSGELLTTSERKMKLQERLRQMASRKKEPSPFEKARAALLDSLLPCFQEGLIPPHMLTLHEIVYFNNSSSLRKHLSPSPRASLHIALTKPTFYLPSAVSVNEHEPLSPNMPDVCIVYLLHLECGRLINLFDWLCSFVAVVDPATAEKLTNQEGGRSHKEDIDPTLQSRFIQAVSELQLLGFVKPTQKKTDHVQRLTWGAC